MEAINRYYGSSTTETESVDSMLAEFTDTAIDFTDTEATSAASEEWGCAARPDPADQRCELLR